MSPFSESQFTQVEQRERQKQTESWVPAMFFATGPGYDSFTGHDDDIDEPHYRQPSAILTKFGFHGGEDVGIWADGPFSELVLVPNVFFLLSLCKELFIFS
uniref:G-patch domain-containing protein n=1 Tax=Angiostrongylus cantonensis TaxID=6313 RepID=A0A0K0DKV6_ANGCA